MRTEELLNLGLTQEQADAVFKLNGKEINALKKQVETLGDEKTDLQSRLDTAENTLQKFDGIDPEAIKGEIEQYKQAAVDAEKSYTAKIRTRDQKDWLNRKLDEYGVNSPFARRQLIADITAEGESGLPWRDDSFLGFDDYMKAAHEKDSSLYMDEEQKQIAAKNKQLEQGAPGFVGPLGSEGGQQSKKYTPPKIF